MTLGRIFARWWLRPPDTYLSMDELFDLPPGEVVRPAEPKKYGPRIVGPQYTEPLWVSWRLG